MVNPDDLLPVDHRSTVENFEKGTLKDEANDGRVRKRLFRPDRVEKKMEEVYLPILIIPGVASSGLFVEESGLDKKYVGRRLWMNAAFLAEGRLLNKLINGDDIKNDENDEKYREAFAETEDEVAMRNAWIYHIGMTKNMRDEKPGNKVRAYEGLFGCEYLVDGVGKEAGYVMGPLADYCVKSMGYEKGKSIDAMPYDWRLAPSLNEERDGYLTKMIARIERMYDENGNLPILLLCHSMGCKMGHYFLNFSLKHKGRQWLDKYVHTYMPVGAPHGGVACAVRTGLTGQGLNDIVDTLVGNVGDGLQMYRTWSCGNWLMPRMLPEDVFPMCIVRREGELGMTLTSEIDIGKLFSRREKPPKELRLTVIYRGKVYARTAYSPVVTKENGTNPKSMTVNFNECFYIAVPNLEGSDEMGKLVFHLEEPAGLLNQNKTRILRLISDATSFLRGLKKKFTACCRIIAKKYGTNLRVATSDRPLHLRVSDFDKGRTSIESRSVKYILEKTVSIRGRIGGMEARNSIGTISLKLSYTPPPKCSGTKVSETPIAMINDETPNPQIVSSNLKEIREHVTYDVMNGTDVFEADGFVGPMFDLVKDVFEGDPIGPHTKSALDAPPVNCVRSIYGINLDTEAGSIYRKVPVVTVGDNQADCRYELDKVARFHPPVLHSAADGYKIEDGIVYETPDALQNVPGKTEKRRVSGDGTVPYWNLIHALTWKDKVKTLTVDELDGAEHRAVIGDQRFFALVKRYCKVIDPRANAMMKMKEHMAGATASGIGTLREMSNKYQLDNIPDELDTTL